MAQSLDDLRSRFPMLGAAVYAYAPGEPVTLEIHDAGDVYTFTAATLDEAVATAFPEQVLDTPVAAPAPTTNFSVFD